MPSSPFRSDDGGAATIPNPPPRERSVPPPWFGRKIWYAAVRAYAVVCNILAPQTPDGSTVAPSRSDSPTWFWCAAVRAYAAVCNILAPPTPVELLRRSLLGLDGLPRHYRDPSNPWGRTIQGRRTDNMTDPHSLAKTIIGLTFQGVLGVAVASMIPSSTPSTGHADHQEGFKLFGVLMLLAFAGSFSAIFLSRYHRVAPILLILGCLAMIIGFFLLTSIFFPSGILTWICWFIAALTVIAIPFALI